MRSTSGIGIILSMALTTGLMAQDSLSVSLDGYVKDLQIVQWYAANNSVYLIDLVHNRISTRTQCGAWSVRFDLRNRIFIGDNIIMSPQLANQLDADPGWMDMSFIWINESRVTAHTIADRAYVQYSGGRFDVTAGRQRINWGIHNIWNPNDIFNAYNFLDFDYEERPGSDALRIRTYLPKNQTLELAAAVADTGVFTGAALYAWNWKQFDFQALAGIFQGDAVVGGGWAGHMGDMGWKGEWSYFIPPDSTSSNSQIFTAAMGMDRSFGNDWYAALSGLYISDPEEEQLLQATDLTRTARSLFPFEWSFHAMAMYAVSPIQSAAFSCIYVPDEDILLLMPMYTCDVSDVLDIDITAQSFFGKTDAEFKHQFTAWYLRGRWSF